MEGALLIQQRGDILGSRPPGSLIEWFVDSFRAWNDASRATTHVRFAPIQEDHDECISPEVTEKSVGQRGQENNGLFLSQSNLDALNRDLDALEAEAVGRTLHFEDGPTSPGLDDDTERQAARSKIMSRKKTGLSALVTNGDDDENDEEVVLEAASVNAAPKSQVSDPVRHAVRLVSRQIELWTWTNKHDGPSPGPVPAEV